MEELLFDHLLKGSRLLEKRCPACHNQLLKKGVTPVLFSPSSVQGNSSFDSAASEIDDNVGPWEPIEGLPYCLACEAHVVTNEFELSFAAEQLSNNSKMQKKGALLQLMDGSRPNSPIKSPIRGISSRPKLSVSTDSLFFNEGIVSPSVKDEKDYGFTKELEEPSPPHKFTNMQKVKALLIPAMQSRAVVSTTTDQEPLSPLSDIGEETDQAVGDNKETVKDVAIELQNSLREDTAQEFSMAEHNTLSVVVEEAAVPESSDSDTKNDCKDSSDHSNSMSESLMTTKISSPRSIDYNIR